MRIAMIGVGYVGLVSGACFSEFGVEVACVDKDAGKIERLKRGEIPIYEPGLDDMVKKNTQAGRLTFTTDLKPAVAGADAVFIAVGTPSRRGDGHADLSYVYAAAAEIANAMTDYTVVVTKSTVPVGTGREVLRIIRENRPGAEFDVASNPEFLREGSAINDFMRPDRVVIGTDSDRAADVLRELYRPLYLLETPIVFTTLETAEMIKYAANTFLATKITFINEIANLCDEVDADVHDVARAMGLDGRIGKKFLHPGPGFGGSCFPKDTASLVHFSRGFGVEQRVVAAVCEANQRQPERMVDKIERMAGGLDGKVVGVLGLSFKPNTDDVRESPAIEVIRGLQDRGAQVRCFDPQAMENARRELKGVVFCRDPYEVAEGSHALVLATEWNEFRKLDLEQIRARLSAPVLVDLRNVYEPEDLRRAGFRYAGVGR
jgi:UDPglucose 6-dehydrogenase